MAKMDDTGLCLDTNVLIAYLKGREPGASAVELAVKNYACYVTAITVYELLFGVARTQKRIGEEAFLGAMSALPFDDAAGRQAAKLRAELIRRNKDIGVKDVFIAAICLQRALPALTLNKRHFSRAPGLEVVTPEELLARSP